MNALQAVENEANKTDDFKVLGLVEKYDYDDREVYKAFLDNKSTVYANFFKNGGIRVTCEQESGDVKLLEDSSGCYLRDLHERQYGLK